jgi:MFS family permease
LTDALLPMLPSEATIYAGVTVMALPGMVLLEIIRRRMRKRPASMDGTLMRRPSLEELRQNLQQTPVVLLLGVNLLVYLSYATVFFFMKSFAVPAQLGQGGMFFTIATVMMIGVRVLGGSLLDRVDKVRVLQVFAFLLILCFTLFGSVRSIEVYYFLAGYYGLCIGIIMPLLNATLFLISPEALRGLNTNLALFMMDAGFFLSPLMGGMFLAAGFSPSTLFNLCGGFLAMGLVLLTVLRRLMVMKRDES